jgi:hypothetical protein
VSVDKSFELLRERRNEVLKRESASMEWRNGAVMWPVCMIPSGLLRGFAEDPSICLSLRMLRFRFPERRWREHVNVPKRIQDQDLITGDDAGADGRFDVCADRFWASTSC